MVEIVADSLDDIVDAFEKEHARSGGADLSSFLPAKSHCLYPQALCELIRIDLEYGWQQGRPKSLDEYQRQFPEAFRDPLTRDPILFEDYRLRRLAGQRPSVDDYVRRFSASPTAWPQLAEERPSLSPAFAGSAAGSTGSVTPKLLTETRVVEVIAQPFDAGSSENRDLFSRNADENASASGQSFVYHRDGGLAPNAGPRPAEPEFPPADSRFLGFHLIKELGRGSFGRVYLASQSALAGRLVAIKLSTEVNGEAQILARLQHTNIVPIFSIHPANPFHAVCMPYYGSTTLKDVLETVRGKESLPTSGKSLTSTLNLRKSETVPPRDDQAKTPSPLDIKPLPAPIGAAGDPDLPLKKLEELSYVDAVVWIASQLADGLAHAHERGILHSDLKPANVLLTEEGRPMLLDFNLSRDFKRHGEACAAGMGGTLLYMAPEHMHAFRGGSSVDERSDIYSLGVILYEVLAGRYPFQPRRGPISSMLPEMIQDRLGPPPRIRSWNRAVSPAVESIVRHCLESNPDCRYQSARQLCEDLERHRHDQPLRFAPDPSPSERARKWVRRHPRLTSAGSVATFAALILAMFGTAAFAGWDHYSKLRALDAYSGFQKEMQSAQFLLYNKREDPRQLDDGLWHCTSALGKFQVLDGTAWQEGPLARRLPGPLKEALRLDVGELLFLAARANSLNADLPGQKSSEVLPRALRLNELATACFEDECVPRAIWAQRADLFKRLGRGDAAAPFVEKAARAPFQGARDRYLAAHAMVQDGKYRQALPLLEEATQIDPLSFSAWFVRGNCHDSLMQNEEAINCYSMCIGLRPEFPWSWFNRGWAHVRQRHYQKACDDFDRVLRLSPELADAYVNRALAWQGLGQYQRAIDDLSEALRLDGSSARVLCMRAVARAKAGDKEGAERDRRLGMRMEPTDEAGWIARGLARLAADPHGAASDFDRAIQLNPRSLSAMQNKAHVLGERLGKDQEAVAVLDKAIALYPDLARLRAGRGVHLARLGKVDAALEDAKVAIRQDTEPPNLYQVACIYALTTPAHRENCLRAVELLSLALRGGYGLDVVDTDTDLNPLRQDSGFRSVVDAARTLNPKIGKPLPSRTP